MFETIEVKELGLAKLQTEVVEMKRCLAELELQLDSFTKNNKLEMEGNAASDSLNGVYEEALMIEVLSMIPHSLFMELLHERIKLIDDIGKEQRRLLDCLLIGNENFIQNTMVVILRAVRLSEFSSIKKRVEAYVDKFLSAVNDETQSLIISEVGVFRRIQADKDASLANEDWVNNMGEAYRSLSGWMDRVDELFYGCINKSKREMCH